MGRQVVALHILAFSHFVSHCCYFHYLYYLRYIYLVQYIFMAMIIALIAPLVILFILLRFCCQLQFHCACSHFRSFVRFSNFYYIDLFVLHLHSTARFPGYFPSIDCISNCYFHVSQIFQSFVVCPYTTASLVILQMSFNSLHFAF